jgi:hypothetical protein
MDFRSLVRHYQTYNPDTGEFDTTRMDKEYADMLGIHPSQLSRLLGGHVHMSPALIRAFLRTFPQAAAEVGPALLAEAETEREAEHVPA